MTNDECRAEALRRVQESDRLFAEYETKVRMRDVDEHLYCRVSHLRQTAAVYAALATDG
jgi:hypothetical protein